MPSGGSVSSNSTDSWLGKINDAEGRTQYRDPNLSVKPLVPKGLRKAPAEPSPTRQELWQKLDDRDHYVKVRRQEVAAQFEATRPRLDVLTGPAKEWAMAKLDDMKAQILEGRTVAMFGAPVYRNDYAEHERSYFAAKRILFQIAREISAAVDYGSELQLRAPLSEVLPAAKPADKARIKQLVRKMLGDEAAANTEIVDQVLDPQGREMWGSYRNGMTKIVDGKADPEGTTEHEIYHQAEDRFLSAEEKAIAEKAEPDAEKRAEGFVNFAKTGKAKAGKLRMIFARLLRRLKSFFGKSSDLDKLYDIYDRLQAGYYAQRGKVFSATGNESYQYRSPQEAVSDSVGWLTDFWETRKQKDINGRQDITKLNRLLGTIHYYSQKVPALKRIFEAAIQFRTDKHLLGEQLFGIGEQDLADLKEYSKKNKADWISVMDYLWDRDRNAEGYTVEREGEGWQYVNMDGEKSGAFETESEAWEAAFAAEAKDLIARGFSPDAAQVVYKIRVINSRQYEMLSDSVNDMRAMLNKLGIDPETVDFVSKSLDGQNGDQNELLNLFDEMKKMGDRRGHYMPRMRPSGRFLLIAKKQGENKLLTFKSKELRAAEATNLKRQGFEVTMKISDKPSEDAFLGANIVAINDLMQSAIERVKNMDTHKSLESMGLKTKHVDYTTKDGTKEDHLLLFAKEESVMSDILKAFGGRHYDDGQTNTGEAWHFVNPAEDLEQDIVVAIAPIVTEQMIGEVFAKQIMSTMAAIIHSRGSRARKIGRNEAVGDDVWQGYELDALKAIASAGKSIAGGTAKRDMAQHMMKIFTGTDISWDEFKAGKEPDAELKKSNFVEYSKQMRELWESYQEQVNERRIDSATQPEAYSEGVSYMNEMLRNEEDAERIFGIVRGLAGVKFLSGIAPALVNVTSLGTTVPAAMKALGKIPAGKTPLLLGRGIKEWTKAAMARRTGKESGLSEESKWLFDKIASRGWDDPLQNMEATSILQGSLGATWSKVTNIAMAAFSVTEQMNRGSTIAATFYGLRAQGMKREAALDKAKEISDKAHGVYGKENLPGWARGSGLGSMTARAFYTYKTFSHNYLQLLAEIGLNEKDLKAATIMLMAPAVIGGAGVSLVTAGLALLAKALFGGEDDPEERFYKWLESEVSPTAERAARHGLIGLLGVNLKGSLSINMTDIVPTSLWDLGGAPVSMIGDYGRGAMDIARGNVVKGVERLSPRVFAGPIRAAREKFEGVTDRGNRPTFYGNERVQSTYYEALLRSFGFNPSRLATISERQWKERKASYAYSKGKTEIYDRIRRYVLNGKGDPAEWAKILSEIQDYNANVGRSPDKSISVISKSSIKRIVKDAQRAPKRERVRAGEPQKKAAAYGLGNDDDLDVLK